MSSAFRIDYVELALLQLLKTNLPEAYGADVNVDSLAGKDFDEEGRLVLQPPAIRVRFAGADYAAMKDNQRLTYQAQMPFEILCFQSSLRSPADERKQTLVLVATVLDQLAGTRLLLSDGSLTMPITLKFVHLEETAEGPVDQLFTAGIDVEGIAQFSGANAQPGA